MPEPQNQKFMKELRKYDHTLGGSNDLNDSSSGPSDMCKGESCSGIAVCIKDIMVNTEVGN